MQKGKPNKGKKHTDKGRKARAWAMTEPIATSGPTVNILQENNLTSTE
jgi:hypothetical protein